jgi:hypothetical protein
MAPPSPRSQFLRWLGNLISDEGFEISFSHEGVYYIDSRGKFGFGYEDGMLSRTPYQIDGELVALTKRTSIKW